MTRHGRSVRTDGNAAGWSRASAAHVAARRPARIRASPVAFAQRPGDDAKLGRCSRCLALAPDGTGHDERLRVSAQDTTGQRRELVWHTARVAVGDSRPHRMRRGFAGRNSCDQRMRRRFAGGNSADRGWRRRFSGCNSADRGWRQRFSGRNSADRGWRWRFSGRNSADRGWRRRFSGRNSLDPEVDRTICNCQLGRSTPVELIWDNKHPPGPEVWSIWADPSPEEPERRRACGSGRGGSPGSETTWFDRKCSPARVPPESRRVSSIVGTCRAVSRSCDRGRRALRRNSEPR